MNARRRELAYAGPMTTGTESARLRLKRPPVRQVRLSLVFRADPPIRSHHVAALIPKWRVLFDSVDESPPRVEAPDDPENCEDLVYFDGSQLWPIPYTQFRSANRTVAFQGDRFEVIWDATAEDGRYVGFDKLRGDLLRDFGDFADTLSRDGIQLDVRYVECYYVNRLPEISAEQLVTGILTNWTATASSTVVKSDYVGMRLHPQFDEVGRKHCAAVVMVDAMRDNETQLSFLVKRDLLIPKTWDRSLREAHDHLIALFIQYTNDSLRESWGHGA